MRTKSIGRQVTMVSRQIIKLRNKCLIDYECEVSAAHVYAFIFFAQNNGCSEKEAVQSTGKDKTSIAKSFKKLCKQQLVYAVQDKTDARRKQIMITEKGKAEMSKVKKALENVSVIMSKNMSDSQLETFFDTLDIIQKNVQSELEGKEQNGQS